MKDNNSNNISKKTLTPYIVKILSEYFNSKISRVKFIGGGSFGMVFKVTQDTLPYNVVVKVCKISDMHNREAVELKFLKEHSSFKLPKVYFVHNATKEIPVNCFCMEYINGKPALLSLRLFLKSKKEKRKFAEKIVNFLLEIHSVTNEKFGALQNPTYENWLDYYKPFAEDVLQKAIKLNDNKKLKTGIIETMKMAYDKFDIIFNEPVENASLIHGDLNLFNIMVNKRGEPIAIIDPLNVMFADREYDLFQLNNLMGEKFGLYNLYKEKYKVSKNCDIKCAFYGLWNEVYCYIKSGLYVGFIMNPLVKNMNRQLKNLGE